MRPAVITVGERLGRYEVIRHLATGGMAEIYLARTAGIGDFERYAVVKVIAGERQGNAQFVAMFLDEARLAAGLHHANIAQVYEVGEEVGEYFYAMEYVHGDTVRSLLEECGKRQLRIPLEVALAIIIAAAAGLHHAHEHTGADGQPLQIVHRDVSPSNLMVGHDGAVKVLDFGIARASERATETESGVVKGKYAYMAPEQCRAQPVDRRADVFALGIILYELTTQVRAFKCDSDFETMSKIVGGELRRPTALRDDYPPALEAIVMRAMAVDPAARYATAADLGDALEGFAEASAMAMSQRAVARFMHQVFGTRPEPWRIGPQPPRSETGTPRPSGSAPSLAPSRSGSGPRRAAIASPRGGESTVAPGIQVESPPAAARGRLRWIGGAAAVAVVGAAIAIVSASSGRRPADPPAAPPGPRAAVAPEPVGPGPVAPVAPGPVAPVVTPPSAPATVAIALTSTPAGATVFIGAQRQGVTPLTLTLPQGPAPVAVRIERAGYKPQLVAVAVDRAGAQVVTLERVPARPKRPPGGGDDDAFANPFAKPGR